LELQHGVDEVLEHPRPGQRALLGDVARAIRSATSRTWPTDPAEPSRPALRRVCTESITHACGRCAAIVASTTSTLVSATIGTSSAGELRRRARSATWAADSSADT